MFVKVCTIPGSDRDEHEKQHLPEFDHEGGMNSPDIVGLTEKAKLVIGSFETRSPIVHQIVRYSGKPRDIILAIVSAKSGFALKEVTEPITNPDTLSKDSDSGDAYIAMPQDKDVFF
ncbi:hypothetical protein LTR56_026642 [Elasticomyces elasticus]|nr:hypothetical protein LTR56_026642 [Elasticomyces elasticus]